MEDASIHAHEESVPKLRVLVCGATGYLGKFVVRALHNYTLHTHKVDFVIKALARAPERLGEVKDLVDTVHVGDATKPHTLEGLCGDVDVVFSSVGLRSFKPKPTVYDVDRDGNLNILEQCKQSPTVRQIVFVSAFKADKLMAKNNAAAIAREAVSVAIKQYCAAINIHKKDDEKLKWTILRPTGFFNDMEDFYNMAKEGKAWLIGDGHVKMNPIHGADLADIAVESIVSEKYWDHDVPCGGPDVFSMKEIPELAFKAMGKPARFGSAPIWLVKAGAALVSPFNVNAGGLANALAIMSEDEDGTGMVAPCFGTHHLADFYKELAGAEGGPKPALTPAPGPSQSQAAPRTVPT